MVPDPKRARGPRARETSGMVTHFGYREVPVGEKGSLVREHFDRVAPTYDFGNTLCSLGLHHLWKRWAVQMLFLREGDTVLDVCGGTADLALLAARYVGPSGRVVLYDCNRAMMERGIAKVTRSGRSGSIAFVCGDAERIAGPEGVYDAAMVGFGIRNLTHMEEGLREIYRVLRPGGRFLCLEFSEPPAVWFRLLYDLYSFVCMPILSQLIVGRRDAYRYLAESIRRFPGPDELAGILGENGFQEVVYRTFSNGIVAVHRAVKPLRAHKKTELSEMNRLT